VLYVQWNGWENEKKAGNVSSKHMKVWTVNVKKYGNSEDIEPEINNRMVTLSATGEA
jgi:hypothetical protein